MNMDVGKILGIVGAVLIGGLILKDASQFGQVMNAFNGTLGTLEKAG